jgi:hypothetical protein
MYIKQEFISDLQRSFNEGEYFVDSIAFQSAIIHDDNAHDCCEVLFIGQSVCNYLFTGTYYVLETGDHFTVLATALNNSDKRMVEITAISNIDSYHNALLRIVDIERTGY